MSSGDDIEAGRITSGESTTHLIAAIPSEKDVDFNGDVIFQVGPQQGELRPNHTIHAILGLGTNGVLPSPGGTGVMGFGGPNQGTGVFGLGGGSGGGSGGNGSGGIGVHGRGGSGMSFGIAGPVDPGPGALAEGGTQDKFDTKRRPNGAGVVATAGGKNAPGFMTTGNVGVFGQGGDGVETTVSDNGVLTKAGPQNPGAGIIGAGGISTSDVGVLNGPQVPIGSGAAGVIGVAGGVTLPLATATANVGVFGAAIKGAGVSGNSDLGVGVRGESGGSVGVVGVSTKDRAGVFESRALAQIRLVPLNIPTPQGNVPGKGGDLLATQDPRERNVCHLWFCALEGDAGTAVWVQVA
jgi:hypothetical protein